MRTNGLPQVDMASPTPRYVQAKTILADAIRSGAFPPGSKLPNTSEIGARLNVSLITAHKAIQCLVEEGWLRRERGRGTFVRGDFEASVAAKPRFRVALVLRPGTELLDFYHGQLMDSLRHAAEQAEEPGELVIQKCGKPEDLARIDADGYLCFHPAVEAFPGLEQVAIDKPVVVLGGSRRETSLHCIDSQNYAGARRAVRHLVEFGHERILIINGPHDTTNGLDRLEGYLAEIKAHGFPVREEYILKTQSQKSAGPTLAALAKVMRGEDRPTAIFSGGYYLALDVMVLLRRMNLEIPRDVSLVGFDDPRSASLLSPALTTIQQPLEDMGVRAYERIVQLIKGENPSPRVELLPTTLVERDSAGPVGG